jgi:hypothetical protein
VDDYLDGLANQRRTAYIDVRERGAAAVRDALGSMRGAPGAYTTAGMAGASGSIIIQSMPVTVAADPGGRLTAGSLQNAGREVVGAIRRYEARNGTGWRRNP